MSTQFTALQTVAPHTGLPQARSTRFLEASSSGIPNFAQFSPFFGGRVQGSLRLRGLRDFASGTVKPNAKRRNFSCSCQRRNDVTVNSVAVSLETKVTDRSRIDLPSGTTPSSSTELITPTRLPSLSASDFVHSSSKAILEQKDDNNKFSKGLLGGVFDRLESKFSPRVRGLILLNMLTFLYGSNMTVVKEAQGILDPFTFSIGRFGMAALAFIPFLAPAFKSGPVLRAGVELGIWASLGYMAQAVGLLTCDAGRAAFIGTFTVIEVPIIAGLFGAKIPSITWWSAGAAVAGVFLLESAGSETSFMGDFWTIVSALIFGLHMIRSEHHTRHITQEEALPLISLQLAVTGLMSVGWLFTMSHAGLVPQTTWDAVLGADWNTLSQWPWMQMAYTGILSTAFCLWVEVVSLRDVSAAEAAMVYTLEPLYGAGFAWVLLGERWGPLGWVGAGLIFGGSAAMQLFGRVEVPEDEPEEIEAPKSTAAIVGALGAAVAIALLMAATGAPAEAVEDSLEGFSPMETVAMAAYGEVELENLVSLMRAYVLTKGDAPPIAVEGGSGGMGSL